MKQITRRNFIKRASTSATAAALVAVAGGLSALPVDAASTGLSYRLYGNGWNDYGRRRIVDRAVYLAGLLSHDSVIGNTYQLGGKEYNLTRWAWNNANLASYYRNPGYKDLLNIQLNRIDGFRPVVNISPYYRRDNSWGEAPLNKVVIKILSDGRARLSGEFSIKLNFYHLGARGDGSSSAVWAGVIAHEMLHNLGHMHGKGDYRNSIQINALQQAVTNAAGGNQNIAAASHFRCGGHG